MFENIKNSELLSIVEAPCSQRTFYSSRASNAFIFRQRGESVYTFGAREVHLRAGEVLFVPRGSSYRVRQLAAVQSNYIALNFQAELPEPKPQVYDLSGLLDVPHVFYSLRPLWRLQTPTERYSALALFYTLLAAVEKAEHGDYFHSAQKAAIQPAVEYLRTHLFDKELSVGALLARCNVSDTYFRRIFVSVFGTAPNRYIQQQRMLRAKSMFDSGDALSVGAVAESVGYDDALYFSKLFKKQYGVSPRDYLKNTPRAQP